MTQNQRKGCERYAEMDDRPGGSAVLLLVLVMFCCVRAATLADGQMKQIMQGRKEREGQDYE